MFIAAIGDSVQRGADEIGAFVPNLIGALLILLIGYVVARVVSGLVWRVLHRAGFDRVLNQGAGGRFVEKVTSSPSKLIGALAFWAILIGAISLAVTELGIPALTAFVGAIYAYLPNVIAAFLIFLVASAISAAVATLVTKVMADTGLGKIIATAAPILVMTIATFMILEQLKIAHDIVVTTYTLLLGAIALGSALAFGLGGREVAGRMLEGAYQKGQENKGQFKRDLDQGVSRAKDEVDERRDGRDPEETTPTEVYTPTGSGNPPA